VTAKLCGSAIRGADGDEGAEGGAGFVFRHGAGYGAAFGTTRRWSGSRQAGDGARRPEDQRRDGPAAERGERRTDVADGAGARLKPPSMHHDAAKALRTLSQPAGVYPPTKRAGTVHTAGWPPLADAMTRTAPRRILRSGEENRTMKSETTKALKSKVERYAKPRGIVLSVVIGVMLTGIFAGLLGFFAWLLF
jgi:hypothetical protein